MTIQERYLFEVASAVSHIELPVIKWYPVEDQAAAVLPKNGMPLTSNGAAVDGGNEIFTDLDAALIFALNDIAHLRTQLYETLSELAVMQWHFAAALGEQRAEEVAKLRRSLVLAQETLAEAGFEKLSGYQGRLNPKFQEPNPQ
jgi:hypothetical protein